MKEFDKLAKVDRDMTITLCDNGFLLSVSGRNSNDDWVTVKSFSGPLVELSECLSIVAEKPLND